MPPDIFAKCEVDDRFGLEEAFLFTFFEWREWEGVKIVGSKIAGHDFRKLKTGLIEMKD